MARVLILSLVFPPDGVSTAQLMGELAVDLAKGGHDVHVVTTQPHYNRDLAAEQEQPLHRSGRLLLESTFRGLSVIHTRMPARRRGIVSRLLGWGSFHILGLYAAVRRVPAPDVILVPSPLLTAGLVAWLVNRLRGGCYIYNVQELYPDLAVQMGRLRNPLVIRSLHGLERFVYGRAGAVTAIGASLCARISERGVDGRRVHMIPNFVDLEELAPTERNNSFAREWDLTDHFIVSYAGNMGHAQGLETVLDAAERCTDPRVRFVLIGDGVLEPTLQEQVRSRCLDNVKLIGYQPYARMPEIYGASDVCLVPLLGDIGASAVPSKVLRIMACGRPILAMCDPASELADLVSSAPAGVVVRAGDADALLAAVSQLVENEQRRLELGRGGRAFVEQHYARPVVTRSYIDLVTALSTA